MPGEKIFRKGLAPLKFGSCRIGTIGRNPLFVQGIHNPIAQRNFGTHHHEVDIFFRRQAHDGIVVFDVYWKSRELL